MTIEGLEQKIIGFCLSDVAVLGRIVNVIGDDYFRKKEHRKLFSFIRRYYIKYRSAPSINVLKDTMKKRKAKQVDIIRFVNLYNACFASIAKKDEFDFYFKEFRDNQHIKWFRESLDDVNGKEGALTLLEKRKKPEEAWQLIKKVGMKIEVCQADDIIRDDLHETADDFLKQYDDEKTGKKVVKGILTGFKEVDEVVGGVEPGQMLLIAGRPGCLSFDTLIPTRDGSWKTIQDIVQVKKDDIYSVDYNLKQMSSRPLDFIYSGKQKVYKVKTESGFELESTNHHEYLVFGDKWKRLDELDVGSFIALSRVLNVDDNCCIDLNRNEVLLLAYLITEGGLTLKYRLTFTNSERDVVEEMNNVCQFYHAVLKCYKEYCYDIQSYRDVKDILIKYDLLGKYSYEKFIPSDVFKLKKDRLALFIGRLWSCDGSLWNSKYCLSFGTASSRLTKDVQKLLLRFGIWSRYKEIKNKKKGNFQITIEDKENIERFLDYIGPYLIGKKKVLANEYLKVLSTKKSNVNKDVVPKDVWDLIKKEKLDKGVAWKDILDNQKAAYRNTYRMSKVCPSRKFLSKIADNLDSFELGRYATSDIYWDRIKSIEYVGIKDTYDFKMNKELLKYEPNFIANNFIVHNSGKSVSVLCMARNMYLGVGDQPPLDILLVSLEIAREQYRNRWEASVGKLSESRLRSRILKPDEYIRLQENIERAKNWPSVIRIVDITNFNAFGLEEEIELFAQKHNKPPDAVIIDYLGIMHPTEKQKSDNEAQARVVEEVRGVGRRLLIPTFSAVQLNRDKNKEKEKSTQRLSRSDIIGATADIVLQITNEDETDDVINSNYMGYYFIKNRNGRAHFGFQMYKNFEIMDISDTTQTDVDEAFDDLVGDIDKEIEEVKTDNKQINCKLIEKDEEIEALVN